MSTDKPYEGPRVVPAEEADRLNAEADEAYRRNMENDALARLTEQSAVRDMRAALAEAGLLDDDYHDRLADRWQLVNDAVDRVCLAFADRREATLEHYLATAAWLACEHPYGFAKALFKHITGRGK